MILIYPVISMDDKIGHGGSRRNLLGGNPDEKLLKLYSNELQVTAQTPPTFLVHAKDDPVKVENSLRFHEALQAAKVPAEIQLYEKGGHGYGLGVRGGDVATWPARCAEWMKKMKLLGAR
jgi:acetyl esterase/lipase